jgi:hypothetical protein
VLSFFPNAQLTQHVAVLQLMEAPRDKVSLPYSPSALLRLLCAFLLLVVMPAVHSFNATAPVMTTSNHPSRLCDLTTFDIKKITFRPACNCIVLRCQVVGKLLTAHKRRSLRMTKQYLQQLVLSSTSTAAPSSPSAADPSASKGVQGTAGGAGSASSAFAQDSSRYSYNGELQSM